MNQIQTKVMEERIIYSTDYIPKKQKKQSLCPTGFNRQEEKNVVTGKNKSHVMVVKVYSVILLGKFHLKQVCKLNDEGEDKEMRIKQHSGL